RLWHAGGEGRKGEGEGRSKAGSGALGADPPAVELDQMARDGEAQPEAALPPRDRCALLLQAFEDVREEGRADALAVVDHADHHLAAGALDADLHPAAGRGELE